MIISESVKQVAESPDKTVARRVKESRRLQEAIYPIVISVLYLSNNIAIVVDLSTSKEAAASNPLKDANVKDIMSEGEGAIRF